MRITEIDHRPYGFFEDGLSPLHLRDLGRIVLLAGANGAGKTRVLRRVSQLHARLTDLKGLPDILPSLEEGGHEQFLRGSNVHLSHFPHLRHVHHLPGDVNRFGLGVSVAVDPPPREGWTQFEVVSFINSRRGLTNLFAMSREKALGAGKSAERLGVAHLDESGVPYTQMVQDRWREATHPESAWPVAERQTAVERYSALVEAVRVALGASLGRDVDGRATVFGRPIAEAMLSEGQQALFLWGVALHAQGVSVRDAILTMDEPENHLHPEALIGTLRRIVDANAGGQLWIATHCVPLVAFLYQHYRDDITLVFMDRGKASYAGREPERVLESLMGGAENVGALR
jgi:hypothetical protein